MTLLGWVAVAVVWFIIDIIAGIHDQQKRYKR